MNTIWLDGRDYPDAAALHAALKRLLDLPGYYGANADALYDCLSERVEPVGLYVRDRGEGATRTAMDKVIGVFEDLGGRVTVAG